MSRKPMLVIQFLSDRSTAEYMRLLRFKFFICMQFCVGPSPWISIENGPVDYDLKSLRSISHQFVSQEISS